MPFHTVNTVPLYKSNWLRPTSVGVKIEVLATRVQDLKIYARCGGRIVSFGESPDTGDFQLRLLAIRLSW